MVYGSSMSENTNILVIFEMQTSIGCNNYENINQSMHIQLFNIII